MRTFVQSIAGVTALALTLLVGSSVITAEAGDGALVILHDDAICRFSYEGSDYRGPATFVITPDGLLTVQCNATLAEGTPVIRATRWDQVFPVTIPPDAYTVPCTVQFAPSGNANLRCHGHIDSGR